MKPILGTTILLISTSSATWAATVPTALDCEGRSNPVGVDVTAPRLSWKLVGTANERGLRQSGYQVLVASSPEVLSQNRGDLWNSGKVNSRQSLGVPYQGKPLRSEQQLFWKVRFWNGQGAVSPWSRNAIWTMGVLRPGDWKAKWIASPEAPEAVLQRLSLGYHAAETTQLEEVKWVQVDLGKPVAFD
ncbi:hypothetical protein EON80_25175, partial [bacterium]